MKKALSLVLAVLMLLTLAACGSQPATQSDTPKSDAAQTEAPQSETVPARDTINVALAQDPGTLSFLHAGNDFYWIVNSQIYEPLYALDENNNEIPLLATSWEKDGLDITFHLREGVKYHDGTDFKADDVLFTMNMYSTNASSSTMTELFDLENSRVIDDYTVVIRLKQENAFAMAQFPFILITNQKSYEASTDAMVTTPVGTGAYKLSKYTIGSSVALEAFNDYWGGAPAIKYANFLVIPEASQRTNALETGEIDVNLELQRSDYDYINGLDGLETFVFTPASSDAYMMNCNEVSVCSDIRVRQALCYATDNEGIVGTAMSGFGTPSKACSSPQMIDYDPAWESDYFAYDMDKAKELIAEAGIAPGTPLAIVTMGTDQQIAEAEVLQASFEELGFDVSITNYDQATFFSVVFDPKGWDITTSFCTAASSYALDMWRVYISANGFSYNSWLNEDFETLLAKTCGISDPAERIANCKQLHDYFLQDVPWYFMGSASNLFGYSSDIEGFVIWNADTPILRLFSFK